MRFENPVELQEAYSILATGDWQILAGGTDFYPSLNGRVPNCNVLDVTNLRSIKGINRDENGDWHIGALTTWTDVIEENLPSSFDGLKRSAREIGSVQIQNRATVVGNICNASPAADGVPPLLTLDAEVNIGSLSGERRMPLSDFIRGNRKTALKPGEIVIGIVLPANSTFGVSSFLKLGARKYLVISISMVAARIHVREGRIRDAALAVGSCSLVAQRLSALESLLVGREARPDIVQIISEDHFSSLTPIDDVRATKDYRRYAAREMVARVLTQTLELSYD